MRRLLVSICLSALVAAPAGAQPTRADIDGAMKRATAFMAEKVRLEVKGVIENMSWFTGDDGTRYELFGAGGGQELADSAQVPLLGQIPLVPQLREGGDEGRPITAVEPDSEAARAFAGIAERVDVELAPTRRYNPALNII